MSLTRRGFLSGLGAGFLGLSLVAPRRALACPPTRRARRFIAVYSANGQPRNLWFPKADIPFRDIDGAANARVGRLVDLPQESMSTILVPELNRFRDRLMLVRGLDMVQGFAWGHYAPKMLNGWPILGQYHRSIDHVIAASRAVYASPVTHPTLHLRIQGPQSLEDPVSIAEVGGVAWPVYGEQHADEAFRKLFASPTAADLGDLPRLAMQKRIMDRELAQYRALAQDPRLGAGDRHRLAAHAALIDDLDRRLLAPTTAPFGCATPAAPQRREHVESEMAQITRDHIDVVAAAIRCDLTRVVTLQLCSTTDTRTYPDAEGGPFSIGHHMLTHANVPDREAQLGAINRTFARSFARLLELLDVVEEPDTGRTFLDNSIVYWGNEFGTNYEHHASGFPVLIAGGRDVLNTGAYLDYRRTGLRFGQGGPEKNTLFETDGGYEWRGRLYNELLISIMTAMGLSPADWETPGVHGFGDYSDNYDRYVEGNRRDPLPGFLKT